MLYVTSTRRVIKSDSDHEVYPSRLPLFKEGGVMLGNQVSDVDLSEHTVPSHCGLRER